MSGNTSNSQPPEAESAPSPTRGRAANIALWVAQALLAALFAFAGLGKLLGSQEVIAAFDQIGLGQWFRYFTGAAELSGAVGLLIPRLSGLAALGLVCVMIGAVIAHLLVLPPPVLALVPVALGSLLVLIARARW